MLLMAERGGGAAAAGAGGIATIIIAIAVAFTGGAPSDNSNQPKNVGSGTPGENTALATTDNTPAENTAGETPTGNGSTVNGGTNGNATPPPPTPSKNYAELKAALDAILAPDNNISATVERLDLIFQATRSQIQQLTAPEATPDLQLIANQLDQLVKECEVTGAPMDAPGEFRTGTGVIKVVKKADGTLRVDIRR